jgi:hypothetical protein
VQVAARNFDNFATVESVLNQAGNSVVVVLALLVAALGSTPIIIVFGIRLELLRVLRRSPRPNTALSIMRPSSVS